MYMYTHPLPPHWDDDTGVQNANFHHQQKKYPSFHWKHRFIHSSPLIWKMMNHLSIKVDSVLYNPSHFGASFDTPRCLRLLKIFFCIIGVSRLRKKSNFFVSSHNSQRVGVLRELLYYFVCRKQRPTIILFSPIVCHDDDRYLSILECHNFASCNILEPFAG
jgi:hypothetical protein